VGPKVLGCRRALAVVSARGTVRIDSKRGVPARYPKAGLHGRSRGGTRTCTGGQGGQLIRAFEIAQEFDWSSAVDLPIRRSKPSDYSWSGQAVTEMVRGSSNYPDPPRVVAVRPGWIAVGDPSLECSRTDAK
jgi:hypothetical protein